MELAFNLVWFLGSAGSLSFWLSRSLSQGGSLWGFQALRGFVALGFALALLFPVISITDDLQALQVPLEEPAPKRILKRSASHLSTASPKFPRLPIGVGWRGFNIFCPRCFGQTLPTDPRVWATRALARLEIRGPPCR